MTRSRLSDIPGLGPKRIKELLAHFRSIDAIQLASVETLAAAPGLGPALARQVWEYFHPIETEPAEGLPNASQPGEGPEADQAETTRPMDNGAEPIPMELAS
jgi:excinuclease ABC subunit C